jgi:nitrite reductase (NO-forming)
MGSIMPSPVGRPSPLVDRLPIHQGTGIFDRVFLDGSLMHPLTGVQRVAVPVGGGSIFELRLKEPGDYPFVTHAFADATKGGVGILKAER